MDKNVLYALIAYWDKSGCRAIADCEVENSAIYRDIVFEVMRSTITTEEERISIQRGKYTIHLLIGELHYAALTLTANDLSSSSRQAFSSQLFLDRLRSVYRELPILADLTRDLSDFSVIDLSTPLNKILEKFNSQELEVVPKLEENLTEIRRILMESVQKLIDRGQKLDELVQKTQTLEITARRDFRRGHKTSRKKKNVLVVLVVVTTSIVMIISTMVIAVKTVLKKMASCLEFIVDRQKLWNEILRLDEEAELYRRIHFVAARKIQSWYRGIATRNHIRMLNEMAIVIQRRWRGYCVRALAGQRLIDRVNAMWQDHYDFSATRIQAAWRGYRERKTGFDVHRTKNWMISIYEKNEQTKEKMRSFREAHLKQARNEIESESLLWILFILFKLHHLLGTKHRPGVLTSMDRARKTSIEKMIKCLEYSVYMEKKNFTKIRRFDSTDQDVPCIMFGTKFARCERAIRDYEKSLQKVSITTSEKFNAQKKSLKAQVESLAREMWGDNYRDTICCDYNLISRHRGNGDRSPMNCVD